MLYLIELFGQSDDQYQSEVIEGPAFDRRGAAEPHPRVWDLAIDRAFEKAVERRNEVRVQVSTYQPTRADVDGSVSGAVQSLLRSTLVEPPRRVISRSARAERDNIHLNDIDDFVDAWNADNLDLAYEAWARIPAGVAYRALTMGQNFTMIEYQRQTTSDS